MVEIIPHFLCLQTFSISFYLIKSLAPWSMAFFRVNELYTRELNNRFQSVFTPKSPLKYEPTLSKKMQDLHDGGNYSQNMSQPPDDTRNKYLNMPDLKISVNGIIKLPQSFRSFSTSPWGMGPYHLKGMFQQFTKRETTPALQIIGSYPSYALCKILNIQLHPMLWSILIQTRSCMISSMVFAQKGPVKLN